MRISDWSSDVCSSDLADIIVANAAGAVAPSDNEPPGAEELVRRLGFGPRPVAGIAGGKKARQCGFAGMGFGIDPRDLLRTGRAALPGAGIDMEIFPRACPADLRTARHARGDSSVLPPSLAVL